MGKTRFNFNTIGLFTRDNKATVDFYTKTFGFVTDWDGVSPHVEMTLGNMRIILFPREAFEGMVSRKFNYPEGFNGTVELAFDVPTFADYFLVVLFQVFYRTVVVKSRLDVECVGFNLFKV